MGEIEEVWRNNSLGESEGIRDRGSVTGRQTLQFSSLVYNLLWHLNLGTPPS